jgi:hypothetical protein
MIDGMETEVISTTNVEEYFYSVLSRYFIASCDQDVNGNLLCTFTTQNPVYPSNSKTVRTKIRKEYVGDQKYLNAVIISALHELYRKTMRV